MAATPQQPAESPAAHAVPRLVALAPGRRLLVAWGAVTGLALLAPLGPPFTSLWPAALAVLVLVAVVDALRGRRPAALPLARALNLGRFQIGVPARYTVALTGIPAAGVELGLALPPGFRAEPATCRAQPGEDGTQSIAFELTATLRGRFPAPEVRSSAPSP